METCFPQVAHTHTHAELHATVGCCWLLLLLWLLEVQGRILFTCSFDTRRGRRPQRAWRGVWRHVRGKGNGKSGGRGFISHTRTHCAAQFVGKVDSLSHFPFSFSFISVFEVFVLFAFYVNVCSLFVVCSRCCSCGCYCC